MKRYEAFGELGAAEDGKWVHYSDAQARIARLEAALEDIHKVADSGFTDATLIRVQIRARARQALAAGAEGAT